MRRMNQTPASGSTVPWPFAALTLVDYAAASVMLSAPWLAAWRTTRATRLRMDAVDLLLLVPFVFRGTWPGLRGGWDNVHPLAVLLLAASLTAQSVILAAAGHAGRRRWDRVG